MILVFFPLLMVLNWKIKLESYLSVSLHHGSTLSLERNKKQIFLWRCHAKDWIFKWQKSKDKGKGELEGEFASVSES